jgi:hypothetical protein
MPVRSQPKVTERKGRTRVDESSGMNLQSHAPDDDAASGRGGRQSKNERAGYVKSDKDSFVSLWLIHVKYSTV